MNAITQILEKCDQVFENVWQKEKQRLEPILNRYQEAKAKNEKGYNINECVYAVTGDKTDYMKQRGIDDKYCQKMILDYLGKFGQGQRTDFENLLLDKLPDILDLQQKKNKIKNNLQALRKIGKITNIDKIWALSKSKT